MAYSDGEGRFWQVDLTTRAGIRNATRLGSSAALFMGAVSAVEALMEGLPELTSAGVLSFAGWLWLEAICQLGAGILFRMKKGIILGIILGIIAAGQLAFDTVARFVSAAMIIDGICAILVFNAVRAVFAMSRNPHFAEDDLPVFE